jgi:hypothetical protein
MKNVFVLLLVILIYACNHNSEKAELVSQIQTLTAEKDSLIQLKNRLEIKMDSINRESNFWYQKEIQGKQFLEMGIKNPKEYVTNALLKKPELIPLKPILGGQMKFLQVELLGKECLIAYYEDGHIGGRGIYRYELKNGCLKFKLIASYLE